MEKELSVSAIKRSFDKYLQDEEPSEEYETRHPG